MGVKENSVKLYITLYTCFTVFLSNTPGKCSPDRRYREWCYTRQIAAALSENPFHDKVDDLAFLESAPGRQAIIDLHVRGIISYVKG